MTFPVTKLRAFTVKVVWALEVHVIAPDATAAREAAETEASSFDVDFPEVEIDAEYGVDQLDASESYIDGVPGGDGPGGTAPTRKQWAAWIDGQREAARRALDAMTEGQRARLTDDVTLPLDLGAPTRRRPKRGAPTP